MIPEDEKEIAWVKDEVRDVPVGKWIYRVACFFIGKKYMTYEEMFLLFYGMYKNKIGPEAAQKEAVQRIIAIYEHNNGIPPEGVEKIYGTQSTDSGGQRPE